MIASSGPLFQQIARLLADEIERGTFAVGDLLPTEQVLSQRHAVSRHTIREALSVLRARGLIESRQGMGSVVLRNVPQEARSEMFSTIEDLAQVASLSPIRPYEITEITVDTSLAERLRGKPGQSYLRLSGLRLDHENDNRPIGHLNMYVSSAYAGIRDELNSLSGPVSGLIERRYGVTIARIDQEIEPTLLSEAEARQMGLPPGTPALAINRWYADEKGRVFETVFGTYPKGRYIYRNAIWRKGRVRSSSR